MEERRKKTFYILFRPDITLRGRLHCLLFDLSQEEGGERAPGLRALAAAAAAGESRPPVAHRDRHFAVPPRLHRPGRRDRGRGPRGRGSPAALPAFTGPLQGRGALREVAERQGEGGPRYTHWEGQASADIVGFVPPGGQDKSGELCTPGKSPPTCCGRTCPDLFLRIVAQVNTYCL